MPPDSIRISPPVRPIVLVALAHMAGLVIGLQFAPPATPIMLLMVVCLAAAAVNTWQSRRIHGPPLRRGWILLVAVGALGAWQGSVLIARDRTSLAAIEPWLHEPAVTVTGIVAEPPRFGPDWAEIVVERVTIQSRERPKSESIGALNIALRLNETAAASLAGHPEWLPMQGQRLRAEGWLVPLSGPANPSTFDSRRYWISRGIGARMQIARLEQVEIGPSPAGWRGLLEKPMSRLRAHIGGTFDRRLSPEPAKLARALVLGQSGMISEDTRDAFQLAGWAHLLAVSGQNAGIVLLLVIGLARLLFLPPRFAAWLGILGVLFYMALTAFMPPVTRAGIMTMFLLGGYALGRQATSPASIALAAFATLVCDPRNITRIDWQLSYVCVLSMILIAPPLYEIATGRRDHDQLPIVRRFLNRYLILPVVVSAAIQLGLLPLQIAYFRQVNILIAVSNIFGILIASLATGFSMATAALGRIPWIGAAAGHATNALLVALGSMADWFAGLPGTVLTLPVLTPVLVAIFYGLLLTGKWLRAGGVDDRLGADQRRSFLRHMTAASGLMAVALIWTPLLTPEPSGTVDLYMLDVGQGDALVLRAGGKTMVIDTGQKDRGRLTVEPFLRSMNIDRIDCLVATHADADHIGGMSSLIDHFTIGRFIEGSDISDSATFAEMKKGIARRRVPTTRARAGDLIAGFGPAKIRLLGPVSGMTDNNGSVVIEIQHGEIDLLLMGDLEQPGENKLDAAHLIHDVEVLKLGHHGSRTATGAALLQKAKPELSLLSVGARNRFNHPSPEVVERLERSGSKILRTDKMGAIWLRSDGERIDVYRYRSK